MHAVSQAASQTQSIDSTLWDVDNFVYSLDSTGTICSQKQDKQKSSALDQTIKLLSDGFETCKSQVSAEKVERLQALTEKVRKRFKETHPFAWQYTNGETNRLKTLSKALRTTVQQKDVEAKANLLGLLYPDTLVGHVTADTLAARQQTIICDLQVPMQKHTLIGHWYCFASKEQRQDPLFKDAKALYIKHFSDLLLFNNLSCCYILRIDPEFQWISSFIKKNPNDDVVVNALQELSDRVQDDSISSNTNMLYRLLAGLYAHIDQKIASVHCSKALILHAASLFISICDETKNCIRDFIAKSPPEQLVSAMILAVKETVRKDAVITLQTYELLHVLYGMYEVLEHLFPGDSKVLLLNNCSFFVDGAKGDSFQQTAQNVLGTVSDKQKEKIALVDYLCLLAQMSLQNGRYRTLVESGVSYMLQDDLFFFEHILKKPQYDFLEPIVSAFSKKNTTVGSFAHMLLQRYVQLEHVLKQIPSLKSGQILRLAHYIDVVVLSKCLYEPVFYQNTGQVLPRSIQRDGISGSCAILLKSKCDDAFKVTGLMKKATKALVVPRDPSRDAFIACRAVSQDKVGVLTPSQVCAIMQREVFIYALLGENVRGIWPLLSSCQYQKTKRGQTFEKVSFISPLAQGTLDDFPLTLLACTLPKVLKYMEDLAYGLWYMHEKIVVHSDVKLTNALINDDCAGWIDFGHAFRYKHESLPSTYPVRYGVYGTLIYTAPELLAHKNFTGDYTKLDVWAFGHMFYTILKNEPPSWQEVLESIPENTLIQNNCKALMKREIEAIIERPLEKLIQKNQAQFTTVDQIHWLLYNMLRLNPDERYTMKNVLDQIGAIRRRVQ